MSYTNGSISEHLVCSIFNLIGITAQKTILGTYTVRDKVKLVCACRDFTSGVMRFFDFCSIKNIVLDSDSNGTGTELSDVLDATDKQRYINPSILRDHFWNVFIADALHGNFDRHNGNWVVLYDGRTESASIAPVFDCGSCLLPQADESVMRKVLLSEPDLHARVFQFPNSALRQNDQKIYYIDFISKGDDPECASALKRIFLRIDLSRNRAFIDKVEPLSALQREFYKTCIQAWYDLILFPVYKRII